MTLPDHQPAQHLHRRRRRQPCHRHHNLSGALSYGLRWYDPNTGRWISRDKIGYGGGADLYGYCGNNPVDCEDSSGELGKFWTCIGILGYFWPRIIGFNPRPPYRYIPDPGTPPGTSQPLIDSNSVVQRLSPDNTISPPVISENESSSISGGLSLIHSLLNPSY
jgi:RHS repeat-associated protein